MNVSFTTPRSISALKSLASKARKATPRLTQTQALNQVAVQAGFANYTHAQRILPDVMPPLELRCRWRNGVERGIEVMKYPFPWSASEIAAMRLKAARIASFRAVDRGLFCRDIMSSKFMARYWIVQAVRELMVMEATGFRPVRPSRLLPRQKQEFRGMRSYDQIDPPGSDHMSGWYDPVRNTGFIMDEPYGAKDKPHWRAAERDAWCQRYGYIERASAWGGTYMPSETRLYLFAKQSSGVNLAQIDDLLATLPDDFGSADDNWRGFSEGQASRAMADVG